MKPKSIRPFLGSDDYQQSRKFYTLLGFSENWTSVDMCYFDRKGFGFYLQNAHVEDWINNTMLFMEVEDLTETLEELRTLDLESAFPKVKLSEVVHNDWGSEFFLHDPSGILWHIGKFKK